MKESIRVENLCKSYQKHEVVKSINFTVWQGTICAFLGPNGAGKSTTMNMLATLLVPSAGKIYIEGIDMEIDREQVKHSIGVLFQEDVLDSDLTIYQNLYYRGGLYAASKKQLEENILFVVEIFHLKAILHKQYGICSGGQRRLVQIARALLSRPKLLILDEPTIGLDPLAREQVWSVLKKLNQQFHMTIFFTTHYMEETLYADHVCMIHQGEVLLCANLNLLKKNSEYKGRRFCIQELYMNILRGENDENSENGCWA